jgi:hypothetical protein
MIPALLLFALGAAAEPAAAAPPRAKPYWMRTYSLAPYRETWSGALEVKKLDAAVPKVVAAVEQNGGRLTQPLALFVRSSTEQQLALTVPLKNAKALLAALRKLGKAEPAVRPLGEKIPLPEVREKLKILSKEKTENSVALAKTPAVSEAVDEMIEHLANVEAVARSTDGEVLWNLTVKEAR